MNQPSQVDSQPKRARLQGDALQAWYQRNAPGQTPEQWEAEWKLRLAEQAKSIEVFAWGLLGVLAIANFIYPLFSGAMVGVFGLWLVLGSGNLWLRVVATAGLTLVLGIAQPDLMAFLLIVVTFTACTGYLASLVAAHTRTMPTRLLQFSLSDIGGCMLALAAGLGMLRWSGFDFDRFEDPRHTAFFVGTTLFYAVNVLFAACPILVPRRYRNYGWIAFAGVMTLVVMPIVEYNVLSMLKTDVILSLDQPYDFQMRNSQAQIVFQYFSFLIAVKPGWGGNFLLPLHLGGVTIVWLLIFAMEGSGAFHDVDITKLTAPRKGPLD